MATNAVLRIHAAPTLRVEAKFKNARLYNAIAAQDDRPAAARQRYGPVRAFCARHQLNYAQVSALLTMTETPFKQNGCAREICLALEAILACPVEDLFPLELYRQRWPILVAEVDGARYIGLGAAPRAMLELPATQTDTVELRELRQTLSACLDRLTPRQADILRRRYGLDGYEEHTLEQVAQAYQRSPQRIREIEGQALRRLRHPARSRQLRPFMADLDDSRPSDWEPDPQNPSMMKKRNSDDAV